MGGGDVVTRPCWAKPRTTAEAFAELNAALRNVGRAYLRAFQRPLLFAIEIVVKVVLLLCVVLMLGGTALIAREIAQQLWEVWR